MEKIIRNFREKIRNTDFEGMQKAMNGFPVACCKVASMFFAKFVVDNNFAKKGDIKFIANALKGQASHSWLEINGKIVDLTIDQFQDIDQFVFEIDSSFHVSFEGAARHSYNEIMNFNEAFELDFNVNYVKLLECQVPN